MPTRPASCCGSRSSWPAPARAAGSICASRTKPGVRRTTRSRSSRCFRASWDNAAKIDFEMKILLESTAPWVQAGEAVLLTSNGRTIQVHVDPRHLEPGVHFAEVLGYDATDRDRGPMFRMPVTVIICHNLTPAPRRGGRGIRGGAPLDDADAAQFARPAR